MIPSDPDFHLILVPFVVGHVLVYMSMASSNKMTKIFAVYRQASRFPSPASGYAF